MNKAENQIENHMKYVYKERLSNQQLCQLDQIEQLVTKFVNKHSDKTITFLTSGGTSVPLQKKSVRFIQNFSTGLRGSLLAQQVLIKKMPLIYFYRQNSHLPFSRGIKINQIFRNEQKMKQLKESIEKFQICSQNLLLLPFTSIYYYLNGILKIKSLLPQHSILILCAAVSDFLPKNVSQHKIHTSSELLLELTNSPKILSQMVTEKHLCVSFKLETDEQKLKDRMMFAIDKYSVDLVIGNLLGNKNWISIEYNPNVFKSYNNFTVNQNVEQNIITKIIEAHNSKFLIY